MFFYKTEFIWSPSSTSVVPKMGSRPPWVQGWEGAHSWIQLYIHWNACHKYLVFSCLYSSLFSSFFLWTLKSHLLPPAVSHVHCFLHVVCTSPGNNQFPECSWLSCLSECWGREGRGVVFVNSQPCQDMPSLPALNVLVWFLWWEWPLGRRETPHLNLQRAEFDFL